MGFRVEFKAYTNCIGFRSGVLSKFCAGFCAAGLFCLPGLVGGLVG